MFRCICGKAFRRKKDLRNHISENTSGIVNRYMPDKHAATIDLNVHKIFLEMPIIPESKIQPKTASDSGIERIVGDDTPYRKKRSDEQAQNSDNPKDAI